MNRLPLIFFLIFSRVGKKQDERETLGWLFYSYFISIGGWNENCCCRSIIA